MPVYTYMCGMGCANWFDQQRTVNERDDETICEKCGHPMTRVYTPPAITFKGTGFYQTDKHT